MVIGKVETASGARYQDQEVAVVYLQGCNLRCSYCAYRQYHGHCENKEGTLEWKDVERFLNRRKGRIEAVVFSGGEPTLHEGVMEYMVRVKERGLPVWLETNGTFPEVLRSMFASQLLDFVSMDVKAPLENYQGVVGRRLDTEAIRTSIWLIKHSKIPHEFTTTVVPGLHTVRELKAIAELVHGADKYVVQDFISTTPLRSELQGRPAFPHKPLAEMRAYVERRVKAYEIRHFDEAEEMPAVRTRRRAQPVAM